MPEVSVSSIMGFRYAVCFVDDYSGTCCVYLLGIKIMQLGQLENFLLTYPSLEKLSASDVTMELNLLQSHSGPYLLRITSNKNSLHHILRIRMEQLRDLGELCLIWQGA